MREVIKYLIIWIASIIHPSRDSKVIYYHDVSKVFTNMGTDLKTIEKHLEIVKDCGYEVVGEITQQKGQVMVCFDDGWAGIYNARSFFTTRGIYPTIFIAVDLIGKSGYLSLQQIMEMQSEGFRFEGHAWSHKDLTLFDDEGLRHEVLDSKTELTQLLGKEVTSLCFPQGKFSEKVYRFSIESGYNKLYSSIPGGYYQYINNNIICRNLVQSVTDREFKCILNSTSSFFVRRAIKQHFMR